MKNLVPLFAVGAVFLTGTFVPHQSQAQQRCIITHANTIICHPQVYRNAYGDLVSGQLGRNNEINRHVARPFSRYIGKPTLRAGSRFTNSVNSRMNRYVRDAERDIRRGPGRSNELVGQDGFVRRTLGF